MDTKIKLLEALELLAAINSPLPLEVRLAIATLYGYLERGER